MTRNARRRKLLEDKTAVVRSLFPILFPGGVLRWCVACHATFQRLTSGTTNNTPSCFSFFFTTKRYLLLNTSFIFGVLDLQQIPANVSYNNVHQHSMYMLHTYTGIEELLHIQGMQVSTPRLSHSGCAQMTGYHISTVYMY